MKQIAFSFILLMSCMTVASCSKSPRQEAQKVEEVGREIVKELCACGPLCGCKDTSMPHTGCGKDDSCGCHEHCSCME